MDLSKFQKNGKFLMLALDHRTSLSKLLADEEIKKFKRRVVDNLKEQFSGVLIDPKFGLPACSEIDKPYLLCVEKSGFRNEDGERITDLEYSIDQLKKMGASGIKLLLYFNPYGKHTSHQIETARNVLDQCNNFQLPLFLEIVTYDIEGQNKSKQELVSDSVRSFIQANILPSVFKLEYPGDENSCRKITETLGNIPWILLTAGEEFETFKNNLKIAVVNGASGFLAGRALWKEAINLSENEQEDFFKTTLKKRFEEISNIALSS